MLSKRARWACSLWLNSWLTHTFGTLKLISIQRLCLPFSPLHHSLTLFSTLLMVPQGGQESLPFIQLFLWVNRKKKGGSDRGREWYWAEMHSWTSTLLTNMAAGRPNRLQTLQSLQFHFHSPKDWGNLPLTSLGYNHYNPVNQPLLPKCIQAP